MQDLDQILNQLKGNNSCITEASLTKIDAHLRVILIYIYIFLLGLFIICSSFMESLR